MQSKLFERSVSRAVDDSFFMARSPHFFYRYEQCVSYGVQPFLYSHGFEINLSTKLNLIDQEYSDWLIIILIGPIDFLVNWEYLDNFKFFRESTSLRAVARDLHCRGSCQINARQPIDLSSVFLTLIYSLRINCQLTKLNLITLQDKFTLYDDVLKCLTTLRK